MRKHMKLIVSLVLVSSVALAGAISVEVGGYQYLKGLVITERVAVSNTTTNALTVGTSAAGPGRAFVLSEAVNNAPTEFTTVHTVIGRTTASGAGSGALFAQYNSSDNTSLIGSLSPSVAWRELRLAASLVSIQQPGAATFATIDGTDGTISTTSTKTNGTITLSSGTGTATVLSGAVCVCTDTTSNVSVKCAVATTTLTATGTGSDVIAYICL